MLTVCHQLYKNGTTKKQQKYHPHTVKEMVNNHLLKVMVPKFTKLTKYKELR